MDLYKHEDRQLDSVLIYYFLIWRLITPVRDNLGRVLKGRHIKVLLQGHIGSVDIRQQYDITHDVPICRKYIENLLRSFKTDYIDLGMVFFIDTEEEDYHEVYDTIYISYIQRLNMRRNLCYWCKIS